MSRGIEKYLALACSIVDMEYIRKHTFELNKLERSYSHSDFKASTGYILELMRDAGMSDIKRYAIPCDGETVYDDCIMPMA